MIPSSASLVIADPRPALDALGIPWVTVTDPNYGYDGTFIPEAVMLHHTASAAGSNTCADVLYGRHYHAAVGRDGLVYLGGHEVRQGHGGEGRRSPLEVARAGRMSLEAVTAWQNDPTGDDTSSMANERTLAVCIDNDGIGEAPSPEQYTAFVATAAAFLHVLGRGNGHLLDHASSTNRKVDLVGTCLELDPSCWFPDIGILVERLAGDSTVMHQVRCADTHPDGRGAVHVRDDGAAYVTTTGGAAVYWGGLGDSPPGSGTRVTSSAPHRVQWAADGRGYVIYTVDGGAFAFGSAPYPGSAVDLIQ